MLNILVNAYACSPNWGSEPGMGWNWIVNLSQYCRVYVITEGEYKELIEEAVQKLPQRENIRFYYNPLPTAIRKMCWNQGDWRFYYYYRKWQKSTLQIARQILSEHRIDVIHQLNMTGFREPGFLWKINIPFVWGPIVGAEQLPVAYLNEAPAKLRLFGLLKNAINLFQLRYSYRVRKAMKRADVLIAATKECKEKIELYYNRTVPLINETGCYPNRLPLPDKQNKDTFDVLWVARFIFSKQLNLALQTIAKLKHLQGLKFHIAGGGTDEQVNHYKSMAAQLGISDRCEWLGVVPNVQVHALMRQCDVLFFPSIKEATSTVVPEAIANNLPVICFNICGMSSIVDDSIGKAIELSTPQQSATDFANEIERLYSDRQLLRSLSEACTQRQQELSWDNKARQVIAMYEAIVKHKK